MNKFLFGNEKEIGKNCYVWNSLAGLINASEAVVLSMVVTRITNLGDAGILTIAFAIGNLLMTIGKFGVRNYQVTDMDEKNKFADYFYLRIASVLIMLISSVGYVIYSVSFLGDSIKKAIVIFCFCSIYMIESIEDVFWGLYQRKGRLDVGGRIFSYRWIATMIIFSLMLFLTKNLMLASIAGFLATLLISTLLVWKSFPYFKSSFWNGDKHRVWSLTKQCVSLFLVSFLLFYITNSPKYALDQFMSDEVQACYGFIFMPVFVIELLNNFLYQPILVKISEEWNEGAIAAFKTRINRQLIIIILLTVICIIGAYFLGIPFLSLLYATDLKPYKLDLLILLVGGGMMAIVGFLSVIMTVMRQQKQLLYGYVIVAIVAYLVMGYMVKAFGMHGASVMFMLLISLLAFIFGIEVLYYCNKCKRQKDLQVERK
ncbi:MAG: lipopolysaccharide biosynthesis protein [Lachnospiraceae bacterium]|nr:lipopolysaccharide biosynthesis protein [Lachnospiraceae bacterium]